MNETSSLHHCNVLMLSFNGSNINQVNPDESPTEIIKNKLKNPREVQG